MVVLSQLLVAAATTFYLASAHPGADHHAENRRRAEYLDTLQPRALAKCAPKLAAAGASKRALERRQASFNELRRAVGLKNKSLLAARDFPTVLAKDHENHLNIDFKNADWATLGQNKSVVLSPETTEGPYYVSGESIRRDVKDGQKGVPVTLDIQMINMQTCEPIQSVAVDIWNCNATGVYGGVGTALLGNGNASDDASKANLQNKMLRGIQISGNDGSVTFDTIVPGHYMGRTNHIHVMSHVNATALPNNTIAGGSVVHVGQVFFDQALIDRVETTSPYAENKQQWTKNTGDFILQQESAGDSDPVVEYVLIGDRIEDGLFAWINFGVDPAAVKTPFAASTCGADGCKANASPFDALGGMLSGLTQAVGTATILNGLGSAIGGLFGFGAQPAQPASPGQSGVSGFGGLFGPGPAVPSSGLPAASSPFGQGSSGFGGFGGGDEEEEEDSWWNQLNAQPSAAPAPSA